MGKLDTKDMVKCGMMAALIFIFTYTFKIPAPNGYTHLGDCFILLSVLILGKERAALAGGVGAALADMIGGYMVWVVPTFLIKAIMAYVMGLVVEKWMPDIKLNYIIGAVLGGILQIILYTIVKMPLFGIAYAITRLPGLVVQTVAGIVLTAVIVAVLHKTQILKMIKEM